MSQADERQGMVRPGLSVRDRAEQSRAFGTFGQHGAAIQLGVMASTGGKLPLALTFRDNWKVAAPMSYSVKGQIGERGMLDWTRSSFLSVAVIATAIAAGSGQRLIAADKPHVALQVKPGLWEFETKPRVSGDTVIANAISARLPAAQLPAYLAETRRMLAQPSKQRECINQTRFEQQLLSVGSGCKQTLAVNNLARLEIVQECRSESFGASQSSISKTASGPVSVTTSSHSVAKRQGKTMIVDSVQTGRWVGPTCAM